MSDPDFNTPTVPQMLADLEGRVQGLERPKEGAMSELSERLRAEADDEEEALEWEGCQELFAQAAAEIERLEVALATVNDDANRFLLRSDEARALASSLADALREIAGWGARDDVDSDGGQYTYLVPDDEKWELGPIRDRARAALARFVETQETE